MSDVDRAREYAETMVPRVLPVDPLQHIHTRDSLRCVYADAFLAGVAAERERMALVVQAFNEYTMTDSDREAIRARTTS